MDSLPAEILLNIACCFKTLQEFLNFSNLNRRIKQINTYYKNSISKQILFNNNLNVNQKDAVTILYQWSNVKDVGPHRYTLLNKAIEMEYYELIEIFLKTHNYRLVSSTIYDAIKFGKLKLLILLDTYHTYQVFDIFKYIYVPPPGFTRFGHARCISYLENKYTSYI